MVVPNGIVPGGSVTVTGTFTNNNPTSSVFFNNITAVVDADGDCDDSWFTIPAQNGLNKTLAAVGGSYVYSGVLTMADTATSQDACKGASIEVTLTAAS